MHELNRYSGDRHKNRRNAPVRAKALQRALLVRVHIFEPQWERGARPCCDYTHRVRQALARNVRARLHAWRRRAAAGPSACKSAWQS